MISQKPTKQIYDISGGVVPSASGYQFTFPFYDDSEIEVYITGDTTDTKVPVVSYTLDKTSTPKIIFNSAYRFLEGSKFLTIIRNVDYVQLVDLRNGEVINAETLEEALDRLTIQTQQLAEKVGRTVLTSVSDTEQLTIPNAAARANMVLAFDAEGDSIAIPTSEIAEKIADLSNLINQINQVKTIADTNTVGIESLETRKADKERVTEVAETVEAHDVIIDETSKTASDNKSRLHGYDFRKVDRDALFVLDGDGEASLKQMMDSVEAYAQDAIMLSLEPIIPTASQHNFGIRGQIACNNSYLYVCVAENEWKKIPLQSL